MPRNSVVVATASPVGESRPMALNSLVPKEGGKKQSKSILFNVRMRKGVARLLRLVCSSSFSGLP